MLTENHIKEGLSIAYIHAVATVAGYSCVIQTTDYGIDGSIQDIQRRPGRRFASGWGIDFQAQASENCSVRTKTVRYDLEVKTHLDLIDPSRGRPLILIVMALPQDMNRWLHISHRRLLLRRCAWWFHLGGEPPSSNVKTVRIKVPRGNIFDVAALRAMMERVKNGGRP